MAARDWLTSSPVGGERRADERSPSRAVPELVPVAGCTRERSAASAAVLRLSDGDKEHDVATRKSHLISPSAVRYVAKQPSMDLALKLGC